jgi:SAM-dependent methyltransferase
MRRTSADLLHRGGPSAQWGNLGLWSKAGPADSYAQACAALADRVAAAAGLAAGQRVLSLACGAGEELLHWVQHHGVSHALGVEADPALAAVARQRAAGAGLVSVCPVVAQPALAWATQRSVAEGRFDAVLCVDAAYHLSPRKALFKQTRRLLQPGGRLAFTDLVLDAGSARSSLMIMASKSCGVALADLLPAKARVQQLQAAGFVDVQLQHLDDEVLGGFARFVQAQSSRLGLQAWHPAWLRPALTAALIGPCRRAGLGYALFSARQPEAGDAPLRT